MTWDETANEVWPCTALPNGLVVIIMAVWRSETSYKGQQASFLR